MLNRFYLMATCPLLYGKYLCTNENFQQHEVQLKILTPRFTYSSSFHYEIKNLSFSPGTVTKCVLFSNSNQSINRISHLLENEAFCTDRNTLMIPHPLVKDKLVEYIPTLTGILAITYQKRSSLAGSDPQTSWVILDQARCELANVPR